MLVSALTNITRNACMHRYGRSCEMSKKLVQPATLGHSAECPAAAAFLIHSVLQK